MTGKIGRQTMVLSKPLELTAPHAAADAAAVYEQDGLGTPPSIFAEVKPLQDEPSFGEANGSSQILPLRDQRSPIGSTREFVLGTRRRGGRVTPRSQPSLQGVS